MPSRQSPSSARPRHARRPDRESFTISDLSAEFGVTARALRFYEDEGLIAPERVGLSRVYSQARPRAARLDPARQARRLQPRRHPRDDRPLRSRRRPRRRSATSRIDALPRARSRALKRQRADIDAAIAELARFRRRAREARERTHRRGRPRQAPDRRRESMPSYHAPVRDTRFILDDGARARRYAQPARLRERRRPTWSTR